MFRKKEPKALEHGLVHLLLRRSNWTASGCTPSSTCRRVQRREVASAWPQLCSRDTGLGLWVLTKEAGWWWVALRPEFKLG